MVRGPAVALDDGRPGVGMRAVCWIFRRHHQQALGPKEGHHQDRVVLKGPAMAFQTSWVPGGMLYEGESGVPGRAAASWVHCL